MECLLKRIVRAEPEYREAGSFIRSIDNAPFHGRFWLKNEYAWQIINCVHPDSSPRDYYFFPKLKIPLKRDTFRKHWNRRNGVNASSRDYSHSSQIEPGVVRIPKERVLSKNKRHFTYSAGFIKFLSYSVIYLTDRSTAFCAVRVIHISHYGVYINNHETVPRICVKRNENK